MIVPTISCISSTLSEAISSSSSSYRRKRIKLFFSPSMAARSSLLVPHLLLLVFLFLLLATSEVEGRRGRIKPADCKPRCRYRCSATSHKKPCMFFCLKCCSKCLCVPPGTYGNKQVCPCYNDWKTQEGGPKCP